MDYEYFKDLSRTASGKAFNIYKNPKYDRYQCEKKNQVTLNQRNLKHLYIF